MTVKKAYLEREGHQFGLLTLVRIRVHIGPQETWKDSVLYEREGMFFTVRKAQLWGLRNGFGWLSLESQEGKKNDR